MKQLNAYLYFNGNCEEALTFYRSCLGGDFTVQTYDNSPMPVSEDYKKKILHAEFKADGFFLMASDGHPNHSVETGSNISLSLNFDSSAEMDKAFVKMAEGGKITMPLNDTFWGARFGMVTDKFGINWMFNFHKPK